jgi:antitoxin component of RelBE/YafQ-DinJ toxin-antitoxin module
MILQTWQQSHSQELQKITETLAKITQLPTEAVKLHLDAMLEKLVKTTELPFYQKLSDEEWIQSLNEWSSNHNPNIPLLSDYAVSRAGIYEDEEI